MTDFRKWFAQFTGCASGSHDWQEQQRQRREFFPGDVIPSALMTELPALASDVAPHRIPSAPMTESTVPFHPLSYRLVLRLSWSKLIELLRIEDPLKRAFLADLMGSRVIDKGTGSPT
jgi:hypothetical protein